jgi:hypothetical protein
MKGLIKKLIPCRFKQNEYGCDILGKLDEPLNCGDCRSYKPKKLIPKVSPTLRSSDYMLVASELV